MARVCATHRHRGRATAVTTAVAVLVVALVILTGCARVGPLEPGVTPDGVGSGPPSGVSGPDPGGPPGSIAPPATVQGGAGTASDRLAATVVAGVEQYWRDRFPTEFGRRWVNIRAFHAVDPRDARAQAPCLRRTLDLANQALYCPRLDTVAWDRTGLLPRLRARYGDGAVLVALAHEIGHAVQDRLDIDVSYQLREPDRYPTILLEAMADCFAGVVVHAAVNGELPAITMTGRDLDRALGALLTFRDPVGMTAGPNAHGDAFDRASAFLDGFQNGAQRCATMSMRNQTFTQRGFTSPSDAARGGDLSLRDLLRVMAPDARAWFGRLVTDRGHPWQPPELAVTSTGCSASGATEQGPVRYCPATGAVTASADQLAPVYGARGDYAGGALVASRYALAALGALGRSVRGPDAGRAAVCLTGAYTRALFDRGSAGSAFGLSPGDIDEAVDELISQDFAARDAAGRPPPGDLGFRRIEQFRAGALGGPGGCGV
jgi:predicted metalloprotease